MKQGIRIAKALVRLARQLVAAEGTVDFKSLPDGLDYPIIVTKKLQGGKPAITWAHQLTDDEAEALKGAQSHEGGYSGIKAGMWMLAPEVSKEAGDHYFLTEEQFDGRYSTEPFDNETKTDNEFGVRLNLRHYAAKQRKDICVRLPKSGVHDCKWNGSNPSEPEQLFEPGSYVFLENGRASIYQRTDTYMNEKIEYVGDAEKSDFPKAAQDDYNEIVSLMKA